MYFPTAQGYRSTTKRPPLSSMGTGSSWSSLLAFSCQATVALPQCFLTSVPIIEQVQNGGDQCQEFWGVGKEYWISSILQGPIYLPVLQHLPPQPPEKPHQLPTDLPLGILVMHPSGTEAQCQMALVSAPA